MLDWMFFTSGQETGVQLHVLVVYDLSTGAVMAMQPMKDWSVETVAAVAQTLETWGHTDVVFHADGETCDEISDKVHYKLSGRPSSRLEQR